MHNSALESFNSFKSVYLSELRNKKFKLIDVGSLSVNSNIKNSLEDNIEYVGIDIVKGENVDIVLSDPYKFPFEDKSVDVVISISNFEHTEFFWLTYLEILRIFSNNFKGSSQ